MASRDPAPSEPYPRDEASVRSNASVQLRADTIMRCAAPRSIDRPSAATHCWAAGCDRARPLPVAGERQERRVLVGDERLDVGAPRPQQRLHVARRAVAEPHPDHFRRRPADQAPREKVVVLGDEDEAAGRGALPDGVVVGALEPEVPDVRGGGVGIGQAPDQAPRQVVVEEELQGSPPPAAPRLSRRRCR